MLRRVLVTTVACAALGFVGSSPAFADSTAEAASETLVFVIDDTNGTIELNHGETSDTVTGTSALYDGESEVGTLTYQCDELSYAGTTSIGDCDYTLELVDGDIDVRIGVLSDTDADRYPLAYTGDIIGGTGAYQGATGEAEVIAENQTRSTITLTLD